MIGKPAMFSGKCFPSNPKWIELKDFSSLYPTTSPSSKRHA
jgi:hypothetical protein